MQGTTSIVDGNSEIVFEKAQRKSRVGTACPTDGYNRM